MASVSLLNVMPECLEDILNTHACCNRGLSAQGHTWQNDTLSRLLVFNVGFYKLSDGSVRYQMTLCMACWLCRLCSQLDIAGAAGSAHLACDTSFCCAVGIDKSTIIIAHGHYVRQFCICRSGRANKQRDQCCPGWP